ncbi:MAG: response regulator transcription factor [Lachnospiraceae bacterium]|nr:response regulator transcription factor [Lachnospiraceae bacterium]
MGVTKVLIVDDDVAIQKLLVKVMTCNNYQSVAVSSGEAALEILKNDVFHLILLDITMGGMDGFQVIQTIREQGSNIPIIVISGRTEDYDTLYGLDIGADDYITKPFNPVILGAKAKALIRRDNNAQVTSKAVIHCGPFNLDTTVLKFTKNDEEVVLSSKELLMMRLFLENPGRVFSKEILYDQIWGDAIVDENAVMVYINHLRAKIEDDPKKPQYIKTVWGLGYKFSLS